jgi:hypothetical protein
LLELAVVDAMFFIMFVCSMLRDSVSSTVQFSSVQSRLRLFACNFSNEAKENLLVSSTGLPVLELFIPGAQRSALYEYCFPCRLAYSSGLK